jgi:hypothetical protein
MACSSSCAAQIACALAVAAAPYLASIIMRDDTKQACGRRDAPFFMVPPPSRMCRTLPDGEQYCCIGRPPHIYSVRVRSPYGRTRVKWQAWCPNKR